MDVFVELFATWWVTWRSFWPVHTSWTSWTSDPMRSAEMAISLKVWEMLLDPSWLWLGQCILKCTHLVTWMSSGSFPKASWRLSLRSLTRGLPSFCLQWGHPSGVMSNPTVSSFSGLGMVASQSDKWCCCLVLVGGADISGTVGGEAVDVSSLPTVASLVVASIPKMVASSMLPVRSCMGYISTPWASGG